MIILNISNFIQITVVPIARFTLSIFGFTRAITHNKYVYLRVGDNFHYLHIHKSISLGSVFEVSNNHLRYESNLKMFRMQYSKVTSNECVTDGTSELQHVSRLKEIQPRTNHIT